MLCYKSLKKKRRGNCIPVPARYYRRTSYYTQSILWRVTRGSTGYFIGLVIGLGIQVETQISQASFTKTAVECLPNRLTPLYFKIHYKEENYLKVRTELLIYLTPPYSKGWYVRYVRYIRYIYKSYRSYRSHIPNYMTWLTPYPIILLVLLILPLVY